jgi:hypothetical protein
MSEVIVSLANGQRVPFDINREGHEPACFVLGIRKCGSTLLNNMCRMMIDMNGRHYVATDVFFHSNVRENVWSHDPAICDMLHAGNIYGGFRMMPTAFASHPIFRDGPKILMVRDPRDALVSHYFSMAFSHPVPVRKDSASEVTDAMERQRAQALQSGIEQMVLKSAPDMLKAFLGYAEVARASETITIKYEDYIFRKADLINVIANHFGMVVSQSQVDQIVGTFDTRPDVEDPKAFVRRVTPGDHRVKLSTEIIAKLNQVLQPAMATFDYRVD